MKEPRKPATLKTRGGSDSEFGTVTIDFRPGPDARDRLRRLYSILLEHAATERQFTLGDDRAAKVSAYDGVQGVQ